MFLSLSHPSTGCFTQGSLVPGLQKFFTGESVFNVYSVATVVTMLFKQLSVTQESAPSTGIGKNRLGTHRMGEAGTVGGGGVGKLGISIDHVTMFREA